MALADIFMRQNGNGICMVPFRTYPNSPRYKKIFRYQKCSPFIRMKFLKNSEKFRGFSKNFVNIPDFFFKFKVIFVN